MKKSMLILGSGKMARNIGAFFLKNNYSVYWVSENQEYLLPLENKIAKDVKRIKKISAQMSDKLDFNFYTYHDIHCIPSVDIILEATTESIKKKLKAISSISHLINSNEALLLSTSSSILPNAIHPSCIGCHFFYPVELTACVEIIFPTTCPMSKRKRLKNRVKNTCLSFIEQTEEDAFGTNRLLLPIQSEVFRLLKAGFDPQVLDEATTSDLLPIGQLTFMDTVGLDVIYSSVNNYIKRMKEKKRGEYNLLRLSLKELLSRGKLGKKNTDGLLTGKPLPWSYKHHNANNLQLHFLYLFLNTCRTFMKKGRISLSLLEQILSSIFQSNLSFQEIERQVPTQNFITFLHTCYKETKLSYFKYLQ